MEQRPAPDRRQHRATISKATQRCKREPGRSPASPTWADAGAIINACSFKPVSFGVVCHAALTDTGRESQCWPWCGQIDFLMKNQQEGSLLKLCISMEVTES